MIRFTAITLVCLQQSTWGFAPLHRAQNPNTSRLNYGSSPEPDYYTNDVPPFSKYESDSKRKQRMEMVRQLRKALYVDTQQSEVCSKFAYGSSIIRDLPVLDTNDLSVITGNDVTKCNAMLPGYQYKWDIHLTEHIHTFHSILAKNDQWFFACLSDYDMYNGDTIRYATLMRITDYRFMDEDGRIVLLVQAMDRLRVVDLSPSYSIPTGDFQFWPEIELVRDNLNRAFPDKEDICTQPDGMECVDEPVEPNLVTLAAMSASAAESFRCRNFEYAPVYLTEKLKGPDENKSLQNKPNDSKATQMIKDKMKKKEEGSKYKTDYLDLIELVNYDAIAYRSLIDASAVNAQSIKNFWTSLENDQQPIMVQEEELFANLSKSILDFKKATFTIDSYEGDEHLPDFSTFANAPSNEGVAMMEYHLWKSLDELIRLLNKVSSTPVPLSSQLMALLPKRNDWSKDFVLEEYSKSMLSQTGPITRVDEITKQSRTSANDSTGYSPLRRALRLSHAVWLLLDGLAVTGANPPPPSRAEVLAMESVFERLSVAKKVLDGVNEVLRRLIPHIKKSDGKEDTGK